MADLFVQSLLSMSPDQRKNMINDTIKGTMTDRVPPATLKEFSIEYFRYRQKRLFIIQYFCKFKKVNLYLEMGKHKQQMIFFLVV